MEPTPQLPTKEIPRLADYEDLQILKDLGYPTDEDDQRGGYEIIRTGSGVNAGRVFWRKGYIFLFWDDDRKPFDAAEHERKVIKRQRDVDIFNQIKRQKTCEAAVNAQLAKPVSYEATGIIFGEIREEIRILKEEQTKLKKEQEELRNEQMMLTQYREEHEDEAHRIKEEISLLTEEINGLNDKMMTKK